jgi:hypothetical protein
LPGIRRETARKLDADTCQPRWRMVKLRVFTVDGPVDLKVRGFWMSTGSGEVVLRGDVPRKLRLWHGEGVLFDPTPIEDARQLEGIHAPIIFQVGNQEIRMGGASVEMRGVTLVIRATATPTRAVATGAGSASGASCCRTWRTTLAWRSQVAHFPPGTSKWNKIEHRMFSVISMNWPEPVNVNETRCG